VQLSFSERVLKNQVQSEPAYGCVATKENKWCEVLKQSIREFYVTACFWALPLLLGWSQKIFML